VNNQNIINNLTEFVNFGEKRVGTTAHENAKNWVVSKYQNWGYTNIELQDVFVSGEVGQNIIVTKIGTTYPDQFIIIDGHYDTIFGPGANDNGSGTAVILEIARILQNIPTEYSIKFIHFTGEEQGLHGSEQYVENIAIPQNLDIKLVLNIDQVGGVAGETNNRITCERDMDFPQSNNSESQIVTNQLATLMELYSDLDTNISAAYASDYVPFQEAGFVITGLYEFNESPFTHSPQDTFQNMDPNFVYQVTKGTLGAFCFFTKAYEQMNATDLDKVEILVYPNPADQFITVSNLNNEIYDYTIIDLNGKLVSKGKVFSDNQKIYTSNLLNGIYMLNLTNQKKSFSQKIIINHL